MRFSLPILLLTTTAAMAQPAASPQRGDFDPGVRRLDIPSSAAPKAGVPTAAGKPYIDDRRDFGLCSFSLPSPVTIIPVPESSSTTAPVVPAPESSIATAPQASAPRNCGKAPEAPKPAPRAFG